MYAVSMETQNQIKRTLSHPDAIKYICNMLDTVDNMKRTQIADYLCDQFNFFDPRGERQRSGCLKALRELEQSGYFVLPQPLKTPDKVKPRRLGEQVPEPQDVPDDVGKIDGLRLVLVETEDLMRIWNELMIIEHPRGAGPLVGRQLRYLAKSEHGWLGGVSFSSSALYLEDRDRWIGWDNETRRSNLHHVVNMSRFLVRPSVSCKNLASCLLGMAIREFPRDFESRYCYRPLLLESFVDTSLFKGTCYRAANWQWIGRTKGRGRQDHLIEKSETVKDIYVYTLDKDFRLKMNLPEGSGLDALELSAGIDGDGWAKNEFGNAPLGDNRLSKRLVEIAANKAENPGRSYNGAADGDWSKVKAYYRLIGKPDDSAVTMANILWPHRERTERRMMAQRIALCIQDGTALNYSGLDKCEGLGSIGMNQSGAKNGGLHLHSTFAITTDGLPLGVLRSECSAPELKSENDNRPASAIPFEEKKNFCWIEGIRDCMALKLKMPHTSIVSVMDREAGFFELFDVHRNECTGIDLLVRAKHDRNITEEHKLFDTVWQEAVKARLNIKISWQSARPKKSKRDERIARVSVRYKQVELKPPLYCNDKSPIPIWVIHVSEDTRPADEKPLEWFLLTTINIKSSEDAINCVKWYCLRWRIEDWHRVLKSGCKTEDIAHKTAERLKRAIAINIVIAWRIMLMTLLGRVTPKLPPDVLFPDLEIEVLNAYAQRKP